MEEKTDMTDEEVLEMATSNFPDDVSEIMEQFNILKSELNLSNYETVLYMMKMITEKQKGGGKNSAIKRIAGRGKGPQQPQELDMETIKRLINEGNV